MLRKGARRCTGGSSRRGAIGELALIIEGLGASNASDRNEFALQMAEDVESRS
jgi:hypothetical protein